MRVRGEDGVASCSSGSSGRFVVVRRRLARGVKRPVGPEGASVAACSADESSSVLVALRSALDARSLLRLALSLWVRTLNGVVFGVVLIVNLFRPRPRGSPREVACGVSRVFAVALLSVEVGASLEVADGEVGGMGDVG